ncbi:MAG: enolase C-terminal domain-like protein, partial [Candidatus Omnitrophota bacterium]
MSTRVKKIDILEVELPFKIPFRHALHERQSSGSVFVKIYLDSGVTGYGEALPREYVTGETAASVREKLNTVLGQKLLGSEFSSLRDAENFIETLEELQGAARCALELALLDSVGKNFKVSVSALIGEKGAENIFYSGVISAGSVPSAAMAALKMKLFGFRQVKVKVGFENDFERLDIIRKILGEKTDIRIDANCAWSADEAIKNIGELRLFDISAVEQPVKADDIEGLKKVTGSVPEAIIADESLRTIEDAKRLS